MEKKTRRPELFSVMYSYVGNNAQFDVFLKMLIHDYLAADQPYTKSKSQVVGLVESHRD